MSELLHKVYKLLGKVRMECYYPLMLRVKILKRSYIANFERTMRLRETPVQECVSCLIPLLTGSIRELPIMR